MHSKTSPAPRDKPSKGYVDRMIPHKFFHVMGTSMNVSIKPILLVVLLVSCSVFADDIQQLNLTGNQEPGNGLTMTQQLSKDGNIAVFASDAENLHPDGLAIAGDFYLYKRDLHNGTTRAISYDENSNLIPISFTDFSISEDGRFVAYVSDVAGPGKKLFIRDTLNETSVLVTTNAVSPSISDNGEYLAFISLVESTLVIYESTLGTLTEVLLGASYPAISGSGGLVSFSSFRDDLVANDSNNRLDTFIYNRLEQSVSLVSVSSSGELANEGSGRFSAISSGGRFVAFWSASDNLVTAETDISASLFVRDLQNQTTEFLVETNENINSHTFTYPPAISDDGNIVAFTSNATNLGPGNTHHDAAAAYYYNRTDNELNFVAQTDYLGLGNFGNISISNDGNIIGFISEKSELVPGVSAYHNAFLLVRANRSLSVTEGVQGVEAVTIDLRGAFGRVTDIRFISNNDPAVYIPCSISQLADLSARCVVNLFASELGDYTLFVEIDGQYVAEETAIFTVLPDDVYPSLSISMTYVPPSVAGWFPYRLSYPCTDNIAVESTNAALNGLNIDHSGQLVYLRYGSTRSYYNNQGKLVALRAPSFTFRARCIDRAGNNTVEEIQP